jgi:hypothetical protein
MSYLVCYTVRMMIKEHTYKVTYRLTPKARTQSTEYIKAYDLGHATRIAKRLFGTVFPPHSPTGGKVTCIKEMKESR